MSDQYRRIPGTPVVSLLNIPNTVCQLFGQESAACRLARLASIAKPKLLIPFQIFPNVDQFCASGPPPLLPDAIGVSDFLSQGSTVFDQLVRSAAFPILCERVGPPPFTGGQCDTQYRVFYNLEMVYLDDTPDGNHEGNKTAYGPLDFEFRRSADGRTHTVLLRGNIFLRNHTPLNLERGTFTILKGGTP